MEIVCNCLSILNAINTNIFPKIVAITNAPANSAIDAVSSNAWLDVVTDAVFDDELVFIVMSVRFNIVVLSILSVEHRMFGEDEDVWWSDADAGCGWWFCDVDDDSVSWNLIPFWFDIEHLKRCSCVNSAMDLFAKSICLVFKLCNSNSTNYEFEFLNIMSFGLLCLCCNGFSFSRKKLLTTK